MSEQKKENNQMKIGNILIRILMTMLVLAVTAFLTQIFDIRNCSLLIAAVVISILTI